MSKTQAVSSQGFFDRVSEYFNPKTVVENVKANRGYIVEGALFAGGGFILGYLIKRNSKYVFAFVLIAIALILLQHMEVITVIPHWEKVHEYLGISYSSGVHESSLEWVRQNIWLVTAGVVGFLFGIKLG